MPIWNSLKRELDRAGQAAQDALDEGRLRLEAHRARQRCRSRRGVAGLRPVPRSRRGGELETERYDVLAANLASAEAEVARLEAQLAGLKTS